jgi:hypothetical protein
VPESLVHDVPAGAAAAVDLQSLIMTTGYQSGSCGYCQDKHSSQRILNTRALLLQVVDSTCVCLYQNLPTPGNYFLFLHRRVTPRNDSAASLCSSHLCGRHATCSLSVYVCFVGNRIMQLANEAFLTHVRSAGLRGFAPTQLFSPPFPFVFLLASRKNGPNKHRIPSSNAHLNLSPFVLLRRLTARGQAPTITRMQKL